MTETVLYVGSGSETLKALLSTDEDPESRPDIYATTTISDAVRYLITDLPDYLLLGSGLPESDLRVLIQTAKANPSTDTLCHRAVSEQLDDPLCDFVLGTFDPDDSGTVSPLEAYKKSASKESARANAQPSNRAVTNRLACIDREGTYLWVNEAMAESIEKPDSAIVGTSIEDAPPRGFFDNLYKLWTQAVRTQTEQRRIVSDEIPRRIVRVYPVEEDQFMLLEEPHRAEFTFDGQYLDKLEDLFFIVDFHGRIIYWNEVVNEVTGYSDSELIGLNAFELFQGEDRTQAIEAIEKLRTSGKKSVELQLVTKDGETIPYQFSASLIEGGNGGQKYFCGIGRDISSKVEMQAEIEAAMEELRRSNDELEHFAYVASHDLKEPIRTIRSFLEILETRYSDELEKDGREYIEFAIDGANRMSSMIDDLLEYSRVSGEVTLETVNANDVFQEAYKNLQLTIQESNARVTSDPLPTVVADESLLVQLFQNLIDNAIKHADDEPKVHIFAEEAGEMIEFTVTDQSQGMTKAETEDIFELFSTGHDETGSGIGLATCKKIVEGHGGSIGVDSEKGVGSAFYFTIPKNHPKERGAFEMTAPHLRMSHSDL